MLNKYWKTSLLIYTLALLTIGLECRTISVDCKMSVDWTYASQIGK